jgi:acyl-CoA hydrolase
LSDSTKIKTPAMSEIQMREMVMPGDTNIHGTIFGGKIMAWIDIAAAMVATKHCETPVVTAHISDIDFFSPINVGHHVIIKASINFAGKSSMIIGVRVESENPYTGQIRKTTKAYLTFVAVNESGKPQKVPQLDPQTENEKRRYQNAKKRKEAKISLNKTLT